MSTGRESHWDQVFTTKADADVSWYQPVPEASLAFIEACAPGPGSALIDVGGGSSSLVDHLLAQGHRDVTVLDVSAAALERARTRLGPRGGDVHWVVSDVTRFEPTRPYHVWHDRAALHFLTDPEDQAAYGRVVSRAVPPGGWVVLATFAPHGPTKCSGLEVRRHDGSSLGEILGPDFVPAEERVVEHHTPSGAVQPFTFARFQRR